MSFAVAELSNSIGGSVIHVSVPMDLPGTSGNGLPANLTHGFGSSTARGTDAGFELFIGSDGPLSTAAIVSLINDAGTGWSAVDYINNGDSWTNDGTDQSTTTYGGVDEPVTGVGAGTGSSTVTAIGKSTVASVGAAAGTTSSAVAHSGFDGTAHGTSTAAAIGAQTIAARGVATGTGTAASLTGLRQAVGNASGTSTASCEMKSTAGRTDLDHVLAAIGRLCEVFKEAAPV